MRRLVIVLGVLGLLVATAAPVAAGGVTKTPYWGAECNFGPTGPPADSWTAGETFHLRELPAAAEEWVWYDGTWVRDGSNATVVNINSTPSGDHLWGTFAFRSEIIGEYDGSWHVNFDAGKALGQGVGASAGDLVKVTLGASLPDDVPDIPAEAGECGYIKIVVFAH